MNRPYSSGNEVGKWHAFHWLLKRAVEGRIGASLDSFVFIQNPKSYIRKTTDVTEKDCGNCCNVLIK